MAILTKNQLSASNASSFPDNTTGAITPAILRNFNTGIIDTLVDSLVTSSYAQTDVSNSFSQPNSFTSISASSFVSASQFVGDGSKITNITASIALPILDEGILQGYATSMNFTGSAISASVVAGTALVQVNIEGAGFVTTSSFNAFTSSTNASITNLNASTASQQVSINALNVSSASQQVSINALNVYTASQDSSSIVNSITELNSWSASAKIELVNLNTSVTNLNSFSSSTNSSITQLNASSASQQVSINALNVSSASLNTFSASAQISINSINAASSSWITESETGSFVTTNTTQTITGIKSFNTAFQMVGTNYIQFGNFSTNTINGGGGKNINIGATNGDGDNSINITTGVEGSSSPFGPDKITLRTPSNNTGNSITLQSANIVMSGSVDINGALTASLQQGYVWVGNASGRTNAVATSSLQTNVSGYVTTSSFNSYTSSNDQRVSSLEVNSASVNTSITNINTTTASLNTSVTNLNSATASLFSSASLSLYTASAVGNTITFTKGDASTFNVSVASTPIDTGSFATTASFNAYTSSNDQKVDSLIAATGSFATTGSNSFNGNQIINGVVSISSSATYDLDITGGFQATAASRVSGSNGIANITQTFISVTSGSGAGVASFTGARGYIQVTGDGNIISLYSRPSTIGGFSDGAAGGGFAVRNTTSNYYPIQFQSTASFTDGRVTFTTPLSASAGFTASLQNGYAWVGNSLGENTQVATSSFGTAIDTGSFATTASFNSYTSSNDQKVNSLISATGSYATTGSNTFIGNQTLTGSLFISGNINMVNGADLVTHHVRAAGSNGLELQTSAGTNIVQMGAGGGTQAAFVGAVSANSISASTINGLGDPLAFSTSVDSRLDSLETTTASLNTSVSNLNTFSSSTLVSLSNLNTTTASLLIETSNLEAFTSSQALLNTTFATTGSNSFNGNQTITGSLILSSSAAVELNVVGAAIFTGSVRGNVVPLSITSNTASMDLNLGNYFTLTLADTATTHISASNVQPGTSATLVITTGTNSSASLSPALLQPTGSAYVATNGSAKKDVLSFVTIDSTNMFVVSTKNMI